MMESTNLISLFCSHRVSSIHLEFLYGGSLLRVESALLDAHDVAVVVLRGESLHLGTKGEACCKTLHCCYIDFLSLESAIYDKRMIIRRFENILV